MHRRLTSARRRRGIIIAAVWAGVWAVGFPAVPAHADSWQADLAVSCQQGHYGSAESTSILSVPLTLKRIFDRGEVSVTLPFVSLETKGQVVIVDGIPQPNGEGGGGSAAGLGDVVLKGKFSLLEQDGPRPYLDLVGRVKLPTAKGDLGTGETDYGFGAEMSYRFKGDYFALADVMYTVIGDPPGTDYRNRLSWDAGVGWQPSSPWILSLIYDYAGSLLSAPPARSLMFYLGRRVRPDLRLYALLECGLSKTAAAAAVTAGVKIGF